MEHSIMKYSEPVQDVQVALSVREIEIVRLAKEGRTMKDYAPDALLKFIANLMYNAKLRLNHATPFADEANMQKMISLDLKKNFAAFTDEEVKKAVAMGLNGDFASKKDEVITFSVANMNKWLKAYRNNEKLPAMAKYIAYNKVEEPAVPSIETQLKNFKTALLYHFGKIKEKNEYYEFDFGNAFYDRLESLRLVSCDAKRKWAIYEEEKKNLMLHPDISDKTERSIYQDWLKHLETKGVDTSNKFEIRLRSMCKRRILKEHIEDWLAGEVDLEEMLTNAIAKYKP